VRGRIVDEAGSPVAGATITTQTDGAIEDNPVWRMLSRMAPDKITRASTQTGSDGTFELHRLAFGAYQLQVTHPEFCEAVLRNLQLTTATETTLAPRRLLRGAVVQGTALLDGKPQAQIHVVLSSQVTPSSPVTLANPTVSSSPVTWSTPAPGAQSAEGTPLRIEAITNNDGRYVLPRRVPPGTYELRAGLQVGTNPHRNIFEELRQMQASLLTVTIAPGQQIVERNLHITDH
jgi:protocatechuate 3,4-dioxygenase beta subunit